MLNLLEKDLEEWTGRSQDHLVCFHLVTILTDQGHIRELFVISETSKCSIDIFFKVIPLQTQLFGHCNVIDVTNVRLWKPPTQLHQAMHATTHPGYWPGVSDIIARVSFLVFSHYLANIVYAISRQSRGILYNIFGERYYQICLLLSVLDNGLLSDIWVICQCQYERDNKGHLYKYTLFCCKTGYVVITGFLSRDAVCQIYAHFEALEKYCISREICSISCKYRSKSSKKYRSGMVVTTNSNLDWIQLHWSCFCN